MGEEKKNQQKKTAGDNTELSRTNRPPLVLPARKLFVVVRRKPCKWAGL